MSEKGSIINLSDISKPATVLIEKISDAVGAIFRPYQIKRIATAESEAAKIRVLADIDISEIQRRAFERLIQEEGRKQENIENISLQAIKGLNPGAKPENVEGDWLTHFFEKCRVVSDKEMQSLWAKLLAGEANDPGNFSKRTVEFVSMLEKSDAQLFTTLCKFGWILGNVTPLVYDVDMDIYKNEGINFINLSHLDDIGLIKFSNIAGYEHRSLPNKIALFYFGKKVEIEFKEENNNKLDIGKVLLTKIGQELAPLCGSTPSETFFQHVISQWKSLGHGVNVSPA
jgi:hypothetical protein